MQIKKKKRFVKKNQICFYIDKKLDLLKKKMSEMFLCIKKLRFYQEKIRSVLNNKKKKKKNSDLLLDIT